MKIIKENIEVLDTLSFHDYYVYNFNYNVKEQTLTIEFYDSRLIFNRVIYYEYINGEFWGSSDPTIESIYESKDYETYSKYVSIYNKEKQKKDSIIFPDLVKKEDIIEIVVNQINGNQLRIICDNIEIVNDKPIKKNS